MFRVFVSDLAMHGFPWPCCKRIVPFLIARNVSRPFPNDDDELGNLVVLLVCQCNRLERTDFLLVMFSGCSITGVTTVGVVVKPGGGTLVYIWT